MRFQILNKLHRIKELIDTQGKRKILQILRILFLPYHEYYFKSNIGFLIKLDLSKDVDCRFYLNKFETNTILFFKEIINSGDIIFDVGANIGIYSIVAGKKVGINGKVFAFEPAEWAQKRLLDNFKLNKLVNIKIITAGVSDLEGDTLFYLCEDDAYNSLGENPMQKIIKEEMIKVITLDEFCRRENITRVNIIKIDTEGADYLVLKGAKNILSKKSAPIIFCEYNRYTQVNKRFKLKDMLDFLINLDYQVYELKGKKLKFFNAEESSAEELICLKSEHYSRIPLDAMEQ